MGWRVGDAVARPWGDLQKDLLRPALEEIIDLGHPLVRLAGEIDWGFLDRRFASVCTPGPGQPGLPTRLVAGLFILKHMHNLSDKMLCARWLESLIGFSRTTPWSCGPVARTASLR
jgi:transposase, IS5 family